MKNLFNLDDFSKEDIIEIIKRALEFKNGLVKNYSNKKVANLFYEASTRTHYSFVVAQQNLNMQVTSVNVETSSTQKNESLYDTVKTFEALGYDLVVIRHSQNEYYKELENIKIPIVSGGDGILNHPSQSLLDLMSIYEKYETFDGLTITIIGDIKHSRVAHTNIKIMEKLGMKVYISGPKEFDDQSAPYIQYEDAIKESDIVMLLRVQLERHDSIDFNKETYFNNYGLKMSDVNKMKENAIIMHPAPINRNIEIADDVVECDKSIIFKQMTNGVYMRMAIIERSLEL